MTLNARQIKQLLAIDQLLGMESVPVKQNLRSAASDERSDVPAPVVRAASSQSRTPAPSQVAHRTSQKPTPAALPQLDVSVNERIAALHQLDAEQVSICTKCPLCKTRQHTVFGEGDPQAKIMLVGEGPGADEDAQGRPFVGRAGQLLDKQITAMGLERQQVYIANIVKCRPPGNRVPSPDEASVCQPYLDEQIAIIRPQVIVALGATAAKYLLNEPKLAITRERGNWRDYRGIKLMPTFHPAYLLRSYTPDNRRKVWDDLQKVMTEVGLEVPKKG